MKKENLSILLMILASICFIISFALSINDNEVPAFRHYLQIISGSLFLILAWRQVLKNRPKNTPKEIV